MLSFKVKCAILILGELDAVTEGSRGLKASELKVKLGFPRGLQPLLVAMKNKRLLNHDAYRGWYGIEVDPERLSLWDLICIIDDDDEQQHNWPVGGDGFPIAVSFNSELRSSFKEKTSGISVAELVREKK